MEAMENAAIIWRPDPPRAFVPADAGKEFGAGFFDEAACREWILTKIHGNADKYCPECHEKLTGIALQRFCEGKRIRCRSCGTFFTALSRTFLAGCHLSFREVILFAVFLYFRIPGREIAKILKISPETVRLWEIKFKSIERLKAVEAVNA